MPKASCTSKKPRHDGRPRRDDRGSCRRRARHPDRGRHTGARGAGAAAVGLAAKLRDSGFKDDRLRKLGAGLKPGSSAIVAVIEHTWVAELEAELQKAGAEVVIEEIATDIAEQLNAGNEVGYTAVADSSGGAAARVVTEPEKPGSTPSA